MESLGTGRVGASVNVGLSLIACPRQLRVQRNAAQERHTEIGGHLLRAAGGRRKDLRLSLESDAPHTGQDDAKSEK